jgi:hypothetical protein
MVGNAGATIVWSSAARNIASRTPTTMSLRAAGSIARLGLVSLTWVGSWRFTVRSSWPSRVQRVGLVRVRIHLYDSYVATSQGRLRPRIIKPIVAIYWCPSPVLPVQDSPEYLLCDRVRPEFMDGAPVFDRGDDRRVWFDRFRHKLKGPPINHMLVPENTFFSRKRATE